MEGKIWYDLGSLIDDFLLPRAGDIVSIHTFGIPIIFVYSDEVARELLEKRGATYSDRPAFHAANL